MNDKSKITTEDIIDWELTALKSAIGCELELTNEFLESNCSIELKDLLMPLPFKERGFHVWDNIEDGKQLNIFGDDGDIKLLIGEIETQLEDPLNELEEPNDHVIKGDLVYTLLEGASFKVNLENIKQSIKDYES